MNREGEEGMIKFWHLVCGVPPSICIHRNRNRTEPNRAHTRAKGFSDTLPQKGWLLDTSLHVYTRCMWSWHDSVICTKFHVWLHWHDLFGFSLIGFGFVPWSCTFHIQMHCGHDQSTEVRDYFAWLPPKCWCNNNLETVEMGWLLLVKKLEDCLNCNDVYVESSGCWF